jgi:hypothetical protein
VGALDEAGAAKALHTGAVGLVVAGLENKWNAKVGRDSLQGVGHAAHVGFTLDNARPGNKE